MGIFDADIKIPTILDVPLERLKEQGITSLIIDVDNTVTEWNGRDVDARAEEWFALIKDRGFSACLVSNNHSGERVGAIAAKLGIPSIHRAGKPWSFAFKRALKVLASTSDKTAVIGDQVFTDVWGGNRMGMLTILVDPISPREFFGTKVMRFLERNLAGREERHKEES